MVPSPASDPAPQRFARMSSIPAGPEATPYRDAREFFASWGMEDLGIYRDANLGSMPVQVMVSPDRKTNLRFFLVPHAGHVSVEFESAFPNGDCIVTTFAPVTGKAASWVDLRALEASLPAREGADLHRERVAATEARVGMAPAALPDLEAHFELRERVEVEYAFAGAAGYGNPFSKPEDAAPALTAPEAIWYYTIAGERRGPISLRDLGELAKAGEVKVARDLAWMPDYPEWRRMRDIPELVALLPPAPAPSAAAPATGVTKPMAASPQKLGGTFSEEPDEEIPIVHNNVQEFRDMIRSRQDPGLGRLGFFIVQLLAIPAVSVVAYLAAERATADPEVAYWVCLGVMVLGNLWAVVNRFRNLSMSAAWLFGLFVPILQWWLSYRLFVCPPGYAEHKRLGGMGVFLAILFWLGLVLQLAIVAGVVWLALNGELPSELRGIESLERLETIGKPDVVN